MYGGNGQKFASLLVRMIEVGKVDVRQAIAIRQEELLVFRAQITGGARYPQAGFGLNARLRQGDRPVPLLNLLMELYFRVMPQGDGGASLRFLFGSFRRLPNVSVIICSCACGR